MDKLMEGLPAVRYALAVLLAITLPPAILYWFLIHPFIGFWRRRGLRTTLAFLIVFYLGLTLALIPFRKVLVGRDLGTSLPLIAAALPLMVITGVVARKRRRHLTFRILAGLPEMAPDTHGIGLLREGIYARIRHPRYLEFILGLTGWTLFANYAGLYVMSAITIVLLLVIVEIEERELRQRFGSEYDEYCARVPRFIPRLVFGSGRKEE
jgi:protein-S-isoprenylcysteine O-methyltransferase Ste14